MNKITDGGESIFNRVRMGYAVIESLKLESWRKLLGEGLGMQVEVLHDDSVSGRLDDHERRLLVVPGASEDLHAVGLELDNEHILDIVLKRLAARGIKPQESTLPAAQLRGVERFWHFKGPKGLEIELYYQPKINSVPPKMATSSFVTGDKGFGHLGFSTLRPDAMKEFWGEIFDCRHSDDVNCKVAGVPLNIEFFRFNERHHSFALVSTPGIKLDPIRARIQHFEVQAATLDDVTNAYVRCRKQGIPISLNVGQHANDRAISFYVRTPSGFDIEYGCNPVAIDEASWQGEEWDRISFWGHQPGSPLVDNSLQLLTAVGSLFRKEYVPTGF